MGDQVDELKTDGDEFKDDDETVIVRKILDYEWPEFLPITDDVPLTYKSNSKREEKVLKLAKNFIWQFKFHYPKRPTIFLSLPNEYGIQKIVCTTICPTILPYPEIYTWDGCAKFVAEFLQYVPLTHPTKLPLLQSSPELVLKQRKGNSLDLSVVLCSLLIASGYDAYIACGYGTRELCLMDETLKPCPLLLQKKEETSVTEIKPKSKYIAKPPIDLSSKYEKDQQERKIREGEEKKQKELEEELKRITELEKPPPDPMHGQRVHFWVLLRSIDRDLEDTFFVEPSTGERRSLWGEQYLGIEYVWNHNNFWINKQEIGTTSSDFSFDLSDTDIWEPFLPVDKNGLPIIEKDSEGVVIPKVAHMPGSWVSSLKVKHKDFEERYVDGNKINYYKYVRTEKFAPYLQPNGLILKISIFKNRDYTELKEVHEHFKNRADLLQIRKTQLEEVIVSENFLEGRKDCLRELTSLSSVYGKEIYRKIIYYSHVRADGLLERHITPLHFSEEFDNRKDFLCFRNVDYQSEILEDEFTDEENLVEHLSKNEITVTDPKLATEETIPPSDDPASVNTEKVEPEVSNNPNLDTNQISETNVNNQLETTAEKSETEEMVIKDKEILRITEKFERNHNVLADEDIEIKTFDLDEEYIRIDFHTPDERITSSFLEFIKPPAESRSEFNFNDDMWSGFQADYLAKPFSTLHLYQTLVRLMEEEKAAIENVRLAEKEVSNLLDLRKQEDDEIHLTVLPYDPTRDNKVSEWRSKQGKVLDKDILWKKRMYDILTPYLARLDFPEALSHSQAKAIYEECRENFINRMVAKANNVQKQLDKEKHEYQEKQEYLYHHRSHMTKKQKDEYSEYFKKAAFKIKALEMCLNRHKETAHTRYVALEKKLKSDSRLAPHVSDLDR